jgi:hypothetical protein
VSDLRKLVDISVLALVVSVASLTTLIPVLQQGFFGDDFDFLNWTSNLTFHGWLNAFRDPGAFNITYRSMALFVYLVYLSGNAFICYSVLVGLYVFNIEPDLFWVSNK